jgi:hypothetical protein
MERAAVNGVKFGHPGEECMEAACDAEMARRDTEARAQHLFGVYVRALRNCDWDGRIWQQLSEGEREAWRKVAAE